MRKRVLYSCLCALIATSCIVGCSCSKKKMTPTEQVTTTEPGVSSDATSENEDNSTEGNDATEPTGEETSDTLTGETDEASSENQSSEDASTDKETNKQPETTTEKSTKPVVQPETPKQPETPVEPQKDLITDFGVVNPSGTLTLTGNRISVHDPSIEYDPASGKYYIFGSHMAWASSKNLTSWTIVKNNINTNYASIFAQSGKWSALGSSNYNISGNLWAPDVIYNKDMKKWCMYMSVNGDSHYSSIAMATADSIDGPYTYQGTVVYSGFRNSTQAAMTDYAKVTGSNSVAARYLKNGVWNSAYGTNAIDPCVLYDKDGQLWMTYGSWFGGLHILKLDNKTGLRDYTYTYETKTNVSDEYLGKRISGGYGLTGEGSYVVWDETTGYYYLYVSYCGLNATDNFSGYHMRLFRSKNIDGPYVDAAGNEAVCKNAGTNQNNIGVKLMGNYFLTSLSGATGNQKKGYMSPGHNSAIVDNEGNHYVIFHTRFNVGQEWHEVRVHQQFVNEDGWLVTAPYEYLGSKISKTGYKSSDIVGEYDFVNHGLASQTTFTGMLNTLSVKLTADGKISGDVTGTWKQVSKNGNGYYATMVINGVTYKGVFFKQFDESSKHKETMTFTLIGTNNQSIWGSKVEATAAESGNEIAHYKFDEGSAVGKDTVNKAGTATGHNVTVVDDSTRGKVLRFSENESYVELPAAATEFDGYTIMMWVKADSAQMWERVFDLGDDADNSMFFTSYAIESGYRLAMKYKGGNEAQVSGTAKLTTNKWTHIAVTINRTNKRATLYVDGKKIGTVILESTLKAFSGKQNYLGKSQYPEDPYFTGYMDDVRIFDYELTESKVNEYMKK